jgi:hypothetical protein
MALESGTNSPTKDDLVYLVNKDKVSGHIQHLRDGTLTMAAADTSLEIPLSRVSQISFAASDTNSAPASPWELRAYFAGGGSVSFELNEWDPSRAAGRSPNFGAVQFDPRFIRQLQFNLRQPKTGTEETEILDEEVWDIE